MKNLFTKLSLCVVIVLVSHIAKAQGFAGGTGSAGNPYIIQTAEQLNAVKNYLGKAQKEVHFQLGQNIALTNPWSPIGLLPTEDVATAEAAGFYGKFNGAGYEITGLQINEMQPGVGLFGYVCDGAVIENLIVRTAGDGIKADNRAGILVGVNGRMTGYPTPLMVLSGGTITNCKVYGKITGSQTIGALIGWNAGNVTNCQAIDVEVTGKSGEIGGLIGANDGRYTLAGCSASGVIKAGGANTGGLIGVNRNVTGYASVKVSGCNTNVTIDASAAQAGGLIGNNTAVGGVENCYAISTITIAKDVQNHGGLIGYQNVTTAPVKNCWANTNITGGYRVGGLIGYILDRASANVENCSAVAKINSTSNNGYGEFGGLIGRPGDGFTGNIRKCWSMVDITANKRIGGLIGATNATIENCYVFGRIKSTDLTDAAQVGGLVGNTYGTGVIKSSYVAVDVLAPEETLGRVGAVFGSTEGSPTRYIGVFYNKEFTSLLATGGGGSTEGVVFGLSTIEMQNSLNFFSGFIFNNNPWNIEEDYSFPYLLPTDAKVDVVSAAGVTVSSGTELPDGLIVLAYDATGTKIEFESISSTGSTWKGQFAPGSVAEDDLVYVILVEGGKATCMLSAAKSGTVSIAREIADQDAVTVAASLNGLMVKLPALNEASLAMSVYNTSGFLAAREQVEMEGKGNNVIFIPAKLTAGIYVLNIEGKNYRKSIKFVIR